MPGTSQRTESNLFSCRLIDTYSQPHLRVLHLLPARSQEYHQQSACFRMSATPKPVDPITVKSELKGKKTQQKKNGMKENRGAFSTSCCAPQLKRPDNCIVALLGPEVQRKCRWVQGFFLYTHSENLQGK